MHIYSNTFLSTYKYLREKFYDYSHLKSIFHLYRGVKRAYELNEQRESLRKVSYLHEFRPDTVLCTYVLSARTPPVRLNMIFFYHGDPDSVFQFLWLTELDPGKIKKIFTNV